MLYMIQGEWHPYAALVNKYRRPMVQQRKKKELNVDDLLKGLTPGEIRSIRMLSGK